MNSVLRFALMAGQYVCAAAGLLLFVYLLKQSNTDPTVNVWLWPVVLIGLSAVFRLARKGVAADK